VNVFLCCVRFSFSIPGQEIGFGPRSPKWPILCRVECKTTTRSVSTTAGSVDGLLLVTHLLVGPQCFELPSVLWRCWLGGRKGIRPVKTEWWGTGVVICLDRGTSDLYLVQLMPLPPYPIISCSSKIQNGLPFWCRFIQVVLEKRPLNGCSSSSSGSNGSRKYTILN